MAKPLPKRTWYELLRFFSRLSVVLLFQYRAWGTRYEPPEGGLLICSNHQSHFDPVLLGVAVRRHLNYLARDTLFGFAPFRWLIRSLDAIPIDREGFGISGIKETLKRLKRGEAVVVFPEGTRTPDGEVGDLKPGICAIARRGKAVLWPAAIDGAYNAWPRTRKFPRRARIQVCFGPPLTPDEIRHLSDDQLIQELHRRIAHCHHQARAARRQIAEM